ncbi:deleted in malignant brain tumors 1 protein-like [Scyliorhinus canicula]|uniref:deleted in malignant brain tumors 1 protein-like n=1 Tax=Scyliorhinus canicula TaxID=7830 RepID=UPI0018F699F7|nr:deleted in malignant brain tumors 1 protein-like [Scyliorhinus canicula]
MQNLLQLQSMGVDFKDDLQEEKCQQDMPYTSEAFRPESRVRSVEQNETLGKPLTQDELTNAVKSFETSKFPGSDGLPAELYSALWDWMDPDLLQVDESMLRDGSRSQSMRKGIITLINKQKGLWEDIRNWRHISLLNVNYKILAKVITNRLMSALESVIHPDQTCALPEPSLSSSGDPKWTVSEGTLQSVKLRLSNGGSRCAGRVEIHYRGYWGTVYQSKWDEKDAAVVCRELGCGSARAAPGGAHFGEGSGPTVTANVECTGSESALRECPSLGWDAYALPHSDDAGVLCSAHRFPRLVPQSAHCAGRLEIQVGITWGTVCDLDWDWNDAMVVCAQLQCGVAVSVRRGAYFGEGTGKIHSDRFECMGNETSLVDCPLVPVNRTKCTHNSDVSVICSGQHGPRLVGGQDRCSGRVEVLHGDRWGTLCDVDFSLDAANVICQHLQCGLVKKITRGAPFGKGTGPVWKENYRCGGNESRLWECQLSSVDDFGCSHGNEASVICSDENWSLRLINGGSRCDGRVEIYYNRSWGRVQDSLWDLNDAKVVCRQLGCGAAIAAYDSSQYGEGEGSVWVNDVQCKGNESHLWNCSSFPPNPPNPDSIDVGVLCSGHKQLRLSDGGSRCAGRLEIYYTGTWGSVCDDSWDLIDADVVCKQLGCGNASQLPLPGPTGPGTGTIWFDEVECSGNESSIWQCPHALWGNHDCNHKEDVEIMCSEHKELRLVNGKHRCEGRVEVFYSGAWGTVCSETLENRDANVICKQLECGTADFIDYDARLFGMGSGHIWLDEIKCLSHETTLWQCQADPWGHHDCYHREDAGIVCLGGSPMKGPHDGLKNCGGASGQTLRLAAGDTKCSGRVEILCNNTWGTVCDDSWDMNDARVVCRQLGCGPPLLAPGGAAFGQGNGTTWLDEVMCTGNESFLSDCPLSLWPQADCDHKEDASVVCSDPLFFPTSSPSTPEAPEDENTSIPLVLCISLGVLLICELLALVTVMQRKMSIKGPPTDGWDSPSGFYQPIYAEIDIIPPDKVSIQTRASADSATIDSLNQIEYYTITVWVTLILDPHILKLNVQIFRIQFRRTMTMLGPKPLTLSVDTCCRILGLTISSHWEISAVISTLWIIVNSTSQVT